MAELTPAQIERGRRLIEKLRERTNFSHIVDTGPHDSFYLQDLSCDEGDDDGLMDYIDCIDVT